VPTKLEMLRDRFKPFRLRYEDYSKIGLLELLDPPNEISKNRAFRLERLERDRSQE
jgi:hypothetical protein